jgi:hypothetical protein
VRSVFACFALAFAASTGSAAIVDFNKDGRPDWAVGVPYRDSSAGVVLVFYGDIGDLVPNTPQTWSQDSPGIAGESAINEFFGETVAAGDFDKDGYTDLAIGVRCESSAAKKCFGAVQVLYGSKNGITAARNALLSLGAKGVAFDQFGWALASGDINGDGYDDAVIGAPFRDNGAIQDAGEAWVAFGSKNGLTMKGAKRLAQGLNGLAGGSEPFDRFGSVVHVYRGDESGKSDDILIGVPAEDDGGLVDTGVVQLILGSALAAQPIVEGRHALLITPPEPLAGGQFGAAVTAGDYDGTATAAAAEEGAKKKKKKKRKRCAVQWKDKIVLCDHVTEAENKLTLKKCAARQDRYSGGPLALATADIDGDGRDDLCAGDAGAEANHGEARCHFGDKKAPLGRSARLRRLNPLEFDAGPAHGSTVFPIRTGNGKRAIVVGAPRRGNLDWGAAVLYRGESIAPEQDATPADSFETGLSGDLLGLGTFKLAPRF